LKDGTVLVFSLGTRILIINSIGEQIIFLFSLVHEGCKGHWLTGRISTTSIE
jgi:hypothetical protein